MLHRFATLLSFLAPLLAATAVFHCSALFSCCPDVVTVLVNSLFCGQERSPRPPDAELAASPAPQVASVAEGGGRRRESPPEELARSPPARRGRGGVLEGRTAVQPLERCWQNTVEGTRETVPTSDGTEKGR